MKSGFLKLVGTTTFIVGIFAIFVLSSGCSAMKNMVGNGNLVTSEKTVSTFEKITCTGFANVKFHTSDKYRVVVTVDENLNEYVEIFTKNNILNIEKKDGYNYKFTKLLIDVYCPFLTGVEIIGASNFESVDKLIIPTFKAKVTGAGKINGTVESETFSTEITGVGEVTIVGKSKNANIRIVGSGNFNGKELNTENATVNVTGSGIASIGVEKILKAEIKGSGEIAYRGNPNVISNSGGHGRIKTF